MTPNWEPMSPPLPLDIGDVHVWSAKLDHPAIVTEAMTTMLDSQEIARAHRFHFEHDRYRYRVAHGFLRTVLSAYYGLAPTLLRFGTNRFGKPYLLPVLGMPTIRFNLSHSHAHALLALTLDREIGIDIEAVRPLDDLDLMAQQVFSSSEREMLHTLTGAAKVEAFYACWSRKEAFIKVLGLGLSMPLDQFDVSLAPRDSARLVSIAGIRRVPYRWQLHDLPPIPGFATALATRGPCQNLRCMTWQPGAVLTE